MIVGNTDLGHKLILAPMAEITDAPFRKIAKDFGAGLTFTQMVSADGVVNNNFHTLRYLSFGKDEKPIGVQVLGNDPDIIGDAVKEICALDPDLIDINCGCPVGKVTRFSMGAALLDRPDLLKKIITSMVENAGNKPVSVKLRLGRDKKNINIIENAVLAQNAGASLLIIHARTKSGKYEEQPDWEWIKRVKESVDIPVVGNGSVFTPQDALRMLNDTGCDSVMISRGAIGNPFIFSRFNELIEKGSDPGEPGIDMISDTVLKHMRLLIRDFGEIKGLSKAKKHIIWYFKYHNGIDYLLNTILRINDASQLEDLILHHSETITSGGYPEMDKKRIKSQFEEKVLFWHSEQNEEQYISNI